VLRTREFLGVNVNLIEEPCRTSDLEAILYEI